MGWVVIIPNIGSLPGSVKATLHITWPENGMTGSDPEILFRRFFPFK